MLKRYLIIDSLLLSESCETLRKKLIGNQCLQWSKSALDEFLSSSQGTSGIKRFIEILLVKMRNSSTWSRWVLDLQNALFQEYLLPENAAKLKEFRKTQEIDETIMVTVLSKRSKEGGFSGRVEELTEALNPYEFAEHLKEGVLLNDLTFQGKRHGSLIHMWHVDMMIYLAKSMKKNPEIVSEFYRWMGENRKYDSTVTNFSSLRVWDVLFDAYDTGFNQPETISPTIYRYFGMTL